MRNQIARFALLGAQLRLKEIETERTTIIRTIRTLQTPTERSGPARITPAEEQSAEQPQPPIKRRRKRTAAQRAAMKAAALKFWSSPKGMALRAKLSKDRTK